MYVLCVRMCPHVGERVYNPKMHVCLCVCTNSLCIQGMIIQKFCAYLFMFCICKHRSGHVNWGEYMCSGGEEEIAKSQTQSLIEKNVCIHEAQNTSLKKKPFKFTKKK